MPTLVTSPAMPSPIRKNGTVLPRMNSTGRIGVTMICSSVPTSRSRTIAKAVRLTIVTRVEGADHAGHEEPAAVEIRVVPGPLRDATLDRRARPRMPGVRCVRSDVVLRELARRSG